MRDRRRWVWGGIGLATAMGLISVVDAKGFRRYLSLRSDVASLEARREALFAENAALSAEIEALKTDPSAIERAAREELGYVKPGEIVFNLESP